MDANGFRIGIGQIDAECNDVPGNLKRIAEMADRAEAEGADHLVLPELALTGYLVDRRFSEAAVKLDGPEVDGLRSLSKRLSISVGLIEETSTALFYNSAIFLEHGKIRHVHRKVYPPTYGMFDERRYFAAGWDVSAFDTDHGRMAMLICGDAWHLPLAYLAAHDGADVMIILAASSREGLTDTTPCDDAWHCMVRSYALSLSCFVAFANLAGPPASQAVPGPGLEGIPTMPGSVTSGLAGDQHFWGGSFVAGPDGNLVAQSQTCEPDLVVADVDFAALRQQRIKLPFRRDDSLAHTIHMAQRVIESKIRRDRFFDDRSIDESATRDLVGGGPPAPKPR